MTPGSIVGVVVSALLVAASSPAFAQAPDPHAGHAMEKPAPTGAPSAPAAPSAENDQEWPVFIPRLSDDDRIAAFPEVEGHAVHDNAVNYFVLFDQLEWQAGDNPEGLSVDTRGWIGRNRDRLWFRAEADADDGRVAASQVHLLYGRQVSRWWDVVTGVSQDLRPGRPQTWAALGVQGLAPYWFEVQATLHVGASGRTHARFEVEYELLLTNRLILQPLIEAEIFGKSDPERGVGAGLSTTDAGVRLRYEFKRELAPYIGITWAKKWGKTANFAAATGEEPGGARFVSGLRLWF
jgi:copper resistance protein B